MKESFVNHELELRIDGLDEGLLRATAMRGSERMSELYELEIDVLVPPDVAVEDRAPRRAAWLSLGREDRRRVFHGIVRRVEVFGLRGYRQERLVACRVHVVPRAWLMSKRRTSRIFQNMSIDAVVRTVLGEYFIPNRWALGRPCPVRAYCTQYEETDLELVQRLTAEAGIFFFFEQPTDPPPFDLPGSPLPGALSDLVARAIPDPVRSFAGGLGGVLPELSSVLGGAREIMVFSDSERGYLPCRRGAGPSWRDLAEQAVTRIADVASQAIGSVAPPAVGAAMQAALGAAMQAADDGALVLRMRSDTGALGVEDENVVLTLSRTKSVEPERFTSSYYDPRRPNAPLTSTLNAAPMEVLGDLFGGARRALEGLGRSLIPAPVAAIEGEVAKLAGAARGQVERLLSPEQDLEIYEHHNSFLYPHWDDQQEEPRRMAQAARRRADVMRGTSICPWLEPGHVFRLEGHEIDRWNRRYVVVAVNHRIEPSESDRSGLYANEIECVPRETPYLPERPVRRNVQACLTATVLGGEGGEILTDPGGHVRVRFHWDRGQSEAYGTCFLRVMQPWAGAGFGTLFLPRHGSEVVVTFEGGDPDRPLILGSVYNAVNQPPAPLPASKTKTGILTRSTPGGEGSNALWFEDAAGREQIHLHAERDLLEEVERDRTAHVGHDDRLDVEGDRHHGVRGNEHTQVGGSVESRVGADASLRVDGNRATTVGGAEQHSVRGPFSATLGGGASVHVRGSSNVVISGDALSRHGGNLTQLVGSSESPANARTHVEGRHEVTSRGPLDLTSDEKIVLRCGATTLTLTPEGADLVADALGVSAGGVRVRLRDDKVIVTARRSVQLSDEILLKSSGAALGLSGDAQMDGGRILLNSPQMASDSVREEPATPTIIELKDEQGRPIPHQPFRIDLGDGRTRTGVLDENGRAEIDLDEGGTISFPGVVDVEQQ